MGLDWTAWIWDDLAKRPPSHQKTDAELPKSATGAAVTIWINDSANLMKLKKTRYPGF